MHNTQLHADFSHRCVVDSNALTWHASPSPLVLDGTLSDEAGEYGPDTLQAPFSKDGCLLFVKPRHIDAADTDRRVVDTSRSRWSQGLVEGLTALPMAEFGTQHTAMVRWAPGTFFNPHRHFGGEEIRVVEGVFSDEYGSYPQGSWIRSPHLSQHQPFSREGCLSSTSRKS